jgi:hypothetical protein
VGSNPTLSASSYRPPGGCVRPLCWVFPPGEYNAESQHSADPLAQHSFGIELPQSRRSFSPRCAWRTRGISTAASVETMPRTKPLQSKLCARGTVKRERGLVAATSLPGLPKTRDVPLTRTELEKAAPLCYTEVKDIGSKIPGFVLAPTVQAINPRRRGGC